jgi:hypothetical protein
MHQTHFEHSHSGKWRHSEVKFELSSSSVASTTLYSVSFQLPVVKLTALTSALVVSYIYGYRKQFRYCSLGLFMDVS